MLIFSKKQNIIQIIIFLSLIIYKSYPQNTETLVNPFENYKYHASFEFLKLMMDSKVKYSIKIDSIPIYNIINKENFEFVNMSPFLKLEYNSDSIISLVEDLPKGEIYSIYEEAETEFGKENYERAKELFIKIIKLDSNWFKGWTSLGDSYYALGDYETAEKYFLKAIELNDIGYQEHLFLSDCYYLMGKYQKSFEQIIIAFMLNRNNRTIIMAINRLAPKLFLNYDIDRLTVPIKIEKVNELECLISFNNESGGNLLPFANCMACWEMEEEFMNKFNMDSINGLITKYKECFLVQASITLDRIEHKEQVSEIEKKILNIIQNKFINEMIYWDILATKYPTITLLLSNDTKNRICEYIKNYCFLRN